MNENHNSPFNKSDEALEHAIHAAIEPSPMDVKQRVLETAAAWQYAAPGDAVATHDRFWRRMIFHHKRLSLAAASTVTALAVGLILYVTVFWPPATAYALEQTAHANNLITSYHVKITPPSALAGVGEAWVLQTVDGTPLCGRIDIFGGTRGDRVGIVARDQAEFWWKANKIRVVTDNQRWIDIALRQCMKMRPLFDPKLVFEQLQADQQSGRVQVATKEPSNDGDPITLTVTSKGDPGRRQVYEVDPQTKLLRSVTEYRSFDNEWKRHWQCDYLDYNRPIDPIVFQPVFPQGTKTIDPSKIDFAKLNLPEGKMSDAQIATKVAKTFFESFVAGRYQRLTQLNDVRTATWKVTTTVKQPGHSAETTTGTSMYLMPSHERNERIVEGRKEVEIIDGRKLNVINLIPSAKLAQITQYKKPSRSGRFHSLRKFIEVARQGELEEVERLGIKMIGGQEAEGFRVRYGSTVTTLWADPKQTLPICMERVVAFGPEEVRTVMSDFQFNMDLEESKFCFDVPAGYAIQTRPMDPPGYCVTTLVNMLKFAAEKNDGVFPPSLGERQGLFDTLQHAVTDIEKKYGKDSAEAFRQGGQILQDREFILHFLSTISPECNLHYAGKGIKLYTPGKPIFWYQEREMNYYRVICADLKVKDLTSEAFQHPLGPVAKPLGDDQFEVAFHYRPTRKVKSVYLTGSFNDWKLTAHRMDGPDRNGCFHTKLKLKKGTYEYKFVLDGKTWDSDPNNLWQGGFYGNSEAHVGLGFTSSGKPLGDDSFEVTFQYRPTKDAKAVYLAGSFNDWKPTALKMDGPDTQGRFSTSLKLKQGLVEYKFVVDGQTWETDSNHLWWTGPYRNTLLYVGPAETVQ